MTRFLIALTLLTTLELDSAHAARFVVIHSFRTDGIGGANPDAGVTIVGDTLYGSTSNGGINNDGTIYRVGLDGTDYQVLHQFTGGATNGASPSNQLILSGETLYGTTRDGGASNRGTVFKINADGSGFQLLHTFIGGTGDGRNPSGLILDGQTLYGTTVDGGTSDFGTIYRMNTDGTGFQILHNFGGGAGDGSTPIDRPTLSGGAIYGTTTLGGPQGNNGVVYTINTDGTGFQLLHTFPGGTSTSTGPGASVTQVGNTLFGTTHGNYVTGPDNGTVYRVNTDGTGFQTLHTFAGSPADGINPESRLAWDGEFFYGATRAGGPVSFGLSSGAGTMYRVRPDGTGFQVWHLPKGPPTDGRAPYGDVTLNNDGSRVYGTTTSGGADDSGAIYVYLMGDEEGLVGTGFAEPPVGATSYVPGVAGVELGFNTSQSPTGGVNPLVGVTASGSARLLTHQSVHATTTFDAVDVNEWMDVTASIDIQVSDTTFEVGDFIHVYLTNGLQSVDVFNQQGTSMVDVLDTMAGDGFLRFSTIVPAGWQSARLVIESSSNSSAGAERFDFDNIQFEGISVPIPEPSSILTSAVGLIAIAVGVYHRRGLR